jgi:hypothetical protein
MKKIYIFVFILAFITTAYSQEVITITYDGTVAFNQVFSSTSTVNQDITIRFIDTDQTNDFYTGPGGSVNFADATSQTVIFLFAGVNDGTNRFQFIHGTFADINSLGQATRVSVAPNTYEFTFNPRAYFDQIPDHQLVTEINFLFENQFGGGGNNQTVDMHIDLVDATALPSLSIGDFTPSSIQAKFVGGDLVVNGLNDEATISGYDLLGRKLFSFKRNMNSNFQENLPLPKNQIGLVRIESTTFQKTLKVVPQ